MRHKWLELHSCQYLPCADEPIDLLLQQAGFAITCLRLDGRPGLSEEVLPRIAPSDESADGVAEEGCVHASGEGTEPAST